MKTSRYAMTAMTVAAVLVLALIASFALRGGPPVAAPQTASPTTSASPSSTASPTATTSPGASASPPASAVTQPTSVPGATGTITGRVGYPSEFAPPMSIYAISVNDPNVWYLTNTPFFGSFTRPTPSPTPSFAATWPPAGAGLYQLSVPAGTYYVIGYSNDTGLPKDISAAYTENTRRCSSSDPAQPSPSPGTCPSSHAPLPVTVAAGQTVRYIDVIDWSFQGGTYPPRPTPR